MKTPTHFTILLLLKHFTITKDELQERILQFILRIIRLSQQLPQSAEAYVIKKQLIRAATSVGANHRAMRRARSGNEYFAKLSIVVEEADETLFWLELLTDVTQTIPITRSFAFLYPVVQFVSSCPAL